MTARAPDKSKPDGFLKTTWKNRADILGLDLVLPVVLTVPAVLLVSDCTVDQVLPSLLVAEFGFAATLFGIGVAGLAVIVAFMTKDYARAISRTKVGAIGEFWPFWWVATIVAAAITAAGVGTVLIEQIPNSSRVVFGLTTFLSAYSVSATVSLVAYIAHAGANRAEQLNKGSAGRRGTRVVYASKRRSSDGAE